MRWIKRRSASPARVIRKVPSRAARAILCGGEAGQGLASAVRTSFRNCGSTEPPVCERAFAAVEQHIGGVLVDRLLHVERLQAFLAVLAGDVYQRHRRQLRIANRETATLADGVTLVATPQESERLTRSRWPKVVISASGMATGAACCTT